MRLRTEGVPVFDCRINPEGAPTRFREEGMLVVAGVRCRSCRQFYRVPEGGCICRCLGCQGTEMLLEHHAVDCEGADGCGCLEGES